LKPNPITVLTYLDSQVGIDQWAVPLQYWLRAGRLYGLRPGEWQHAAMSRVDGQLTLTVRNAKHTNGRGNGPVRTLQLDRMIPVELNDIREMLEMVDDITGEMPFASLQKRVSEYLHDIVRQVLKPGGGAVATWPTLYPLRHQLLADAKRTLTQPEVAAIAGHASDATAGQHYGRRRSGVRAPAVAPSPGDVATVRRRARAFVLAPGSAPRR
jgi:integrase